MTATPLAHTASWSAGLECLRKRQYWEAHEHFEALWRPLPNGPRREALQALIQVAAAAYKPQQASGGRSPSGMQRGMTCLLASASNHLDAASGFTLDWDTSALRSALADLAAIHQRWCEGHPLDDVRDATATLMGRLADALTGSP